MAESYAEQLERVQTTIATIEQKGQAYGIGGRRLDRADLETLYTRENWLRLMADREANGGKVRVQYVVPRD